MSLTQLARARRSSARWPWILGGIALLALIAFGIGGALALPRIERVFPPPGSTGHSTRTPLRLTFNQPMNTRTVEAALSIDPPTPGELRWQGHTLTFIPQTPWPLSHTITIALNGGQAASGLPLFGATTWTFDIGPRRVLYLGGAPVSNVWMAEVNGDHRPHALTTEAHGVLDFTLSPDGAEVIYAAWRPDGGADLRRIGLDGNEVADVRLCPGEACLAPTFSPDGQRLAYQRHVLHTAEDGSSSLGAARLYVLDQATGDDTLQSDPASDARQPRWAGNARLAYFNPALEQIVLRDLATGQTRLTQASPSGVMGTWSADGDVLIYPDLAFLPDTLSPAPTPDPTNTGEVSGDSPILFYTYLVRLSVGTGVTQTLSGDGIVNDTGPVLAPSGAWVAFARLTRDQRQWSPGRQIWLMRADGSEAHALTADPLYNHSAFAWSVDERQLAYTRFNTGEPGAPAEVWVISLDGTGARRLDLGSLPEWVP
jgi:Tol biopolymer transport system component